MSTDTDFLQLINDRIAVWSPTAKKYFFRNDIQEKFGLMPENYILLKSLTGDTSDNIPGIRGAGLKTLQKRMPLLFEDKQLSLDDILSDANARRDEAKILATIADNKDKLELNHQLMQLQEVEISGVAKESIRDIVSRPIQRLVKYEFLKYLLEDRLTLVKNPDFWLRDSFYYLDTMAEQKG